MAAAAPDLGPGTEGGDGADAAAAGGVAAAGGAAAAAGVAAGPVGPALKKLLQFLHQVRNNPNLHHQSFRITQNTSLNPH